MVTLLFTDIVGSTRLIEELGEEGYVAALGEHRRVLRSAFSAHRGVEVDTQGDAFLYAFADPVDALAAAAQGQEALASGPVRVRIGLHTGEVRLTGEGYAGRELHRAARIASSGHGGQVVVSAATRALVDGELTDLGEHRLKDFEEPIVLFQLGRERFPPLKTISNTNLPRPASSFVGRHRERDEVASLLRNDTRLVTLSGPGGSGKTRLAVEAASELVPDFKAGVFWVGLASLRESALVTETIAQTLGAKDGLAEHIGDRELLLLLDNFEQVVDAAPDLGELLERCSNLKLLVTSRELLRIRGEVDYPVPPLAGPEAVELFCARSRLGPDEMIAELCGRLDELPLAIELAAARTPVLSPAQILERLSQRLDLLKGGRDAEARQQTLRATIQWSHDLLTDDERRLFAHLAVFRGGCTLEAAEHVAGADLDTLQSLVDKSLLRHTQERFWMLETIRAFAAERLESLPDAGHTCERYARWYLQLAQTAHGELRGPAAAKWMARLDPELENLRGAIGWARTYDRRLEVELAGAIWYFLAVRGLLRETDEYVLHALETAERAPDLDQSELLYAAAYVAARFNDLPAMERWSKRRLELGRARGDGPVIARSLLGLALAMESDPERSRTLCLESAEVARDCGDTLTLALATVGLGSIAWEARDVETARPLLQHGVELAREVSDARCEASALCDLFSIALAEGSIDEAEDHMRRCLRLASSVGYREFVFWSLFGLAEVAARRGETARAARLLGAADTVREQVGYGDPESLEQEQRARIAAALDTADAELVEAESEGRALTLDEAVAYGLAG